MGAMIGWIILHSIPCIREKFRTPLSNSRVATEGERREEKRREER